MRKGKKRIKYGFPYKHKPLSDYLQNNDITVKEFALKLGKSYMTVNQLLNMIRPVSVSGAMDIIRATGDHFKMEELINPPVNVP